MSQQGLLSVRYADSIPWLVSMTDLGELALKLGGWLSLAEDDGVFVGGSNNTYIYGDVSNVQIQQGSEGCKQIGVEGKCPDAVKLLLELEENEGLRSLFGEKGREVFSCAKVAACGDMSVIYVVDDWGFVEILDQKKIRRTGYATTRANS